MTEENNTQTPTTINRRSEAVRLLCDAAMGLTSTARTVSRGIPADTYRFVQMYELAKKAAQTFEEMPKDWDATEGLDNDKMEIATALASAAEFALLAVKDIFEGRDLTDRQLFVSIVTAEGFFGRALRAIRKDRYVPLARQVWGPNWGKVRRKKGAQAEQLQLR